MNMAAELAPDRSASSACGQARCDRVPPGRRRPRGADARAREARPARTHRPTRGVARWIGHLVDLEADWVTGSCSRSTAAASWAHRACDPAASRRSPPPGGGTNFGNRSTRNGSRTSGRCRCRSSRPSPRPRAPRPSCPSIEYPVARWRSGTAAPVEDRQAVDRHRPEPGPRLLVVGPLEVDVAAGELEQVRIRRWSIERS